MTGVTVNTVRKELRWRGYRRIVRFTDKVPEAIAPSQDPENNLLNKRFYEVLDKMKREERIVFVLHEMQGETVAEIARIGGYSVATAKRRLATARASFKRYAEKDAILASVGEA